MGQNQKNTQEPDMNQLKKVRREKLAELQQNGRDPFQITKFNQTHHSLEVKDLYEAHEAEILKDHQQPNVEGMDEEQAKEEIYSFWSVLSGLQMYSIALSTVVLIPWIFVTAIFFPLTPLYRPDPFGKLHWCCLYDG